MKDSNAKENIFSKKVAKSFTLNSKLLQNKHTNWIIVRFSKEPPYTWGEIDHCAHPYARWQHLDVSLTVFELIHWTELGSQCHWYWQWRSNSVSNLVRARRDSLARPMLYPSPCSVQYGAPDHQCVYWRGGSDFRMLTKVPCSGYPSGDSVWS